MQSPVYHVNRGHKFPPECPSRKEQSGDLKFPVYNVDSHHKFQDKAPAHFKLNNLQGPVFDVARESKYSPEEARKPGELAQTGPVYRGVDDHNKYHPQAEKVKSDPGMFGPKFPVESANKYIPQAGPKVETERLMAAPHYRGINIEHNNNFNPDLTQKPSEALMVGPKLPNVDYSHHYGPVPPKASDPYKNF